MKLQWLKVFFSSWCPSLTSTVCGSDRTSLLQVWTFPQFQEAQIKTTRTKKLGTQVIKTEQHKKPIPRIDCFLYLGTLDSEKRQQTMKSTRRITSSDNVCVYLCHRGGIEGQIPCALLSGERRRMWTGISFLLPLEGNLGGYREIRDLLYSMRSDWLSLVLLLGDC